MSSFSPKPAHIKTRAFLDALTELCKEHAVQLTSREPINVIPIDDDFIAYYPNFYYSDSKGVEIKLLAYSDIDQIHYYFENDCL